MANLGIFNEFHLSKRCPYINNIQSHNQCVISGHLLFRFFLPAPGGPFAGGSWGVGGFVTPFGVVDWVPAGVGVAEDRAPASTISVVPISGPFSRP